MLRDLNTPEAKRHLGGPEPDEKVLDRHRRYLTSEGFGTGRMYRILLDGVDRSVGTVGFYERVWQGAEVYEIGWGVLPAYQGRGIAVAATRLAVEAAREAGARRYLHAFPSVDNAASNAVARKAGFERVGECDVEFPPGQWMRSNDWRLDLFRHWDASRSGPSGGVSRAGS
ncbi:hypothetical protein GCM10023085_41900 [Actinomadura viridis]